MNIRIHKKKIILFFVFLISLFFILFGVINTSVFQKNIFSFLSKKIQENYSVSINSEDFYYNFLKNSFSSDFLIIDHYGNPMITIPDISIKFQKNILFSSSVIIE